MNLQKASKKDGFTIIEVVLVLAIAALIFLIVFLAVPALQRSQRDTQRRNDMSRFLSQLQNYQANNKGQVPAQNTTQIQAFRDRYLTANGDVWADPQRDDYNLQAGTGDPAATGDVVYSVGYKCDGENLTTTGAGTRSVAVRTLLEGGGIHCLNN